MSDCECGMTFWNFAERHLAFVGCSAAGVSVLLLMVTADISAAIRSRRNRVSGSIQKGGSR